ncbi:MAG: hypothetical protein OEW24_04395 [Chloroflexota bacterium]|nr:hypothetical protein [Chloroflexota bacterium]
MLTLTDAPADPLTDSSAEMLGETAAAHADTAIATMRTPDAAADRLIGPG